MRLSSHRENEVLLQLSGFRYLAAPMIEGFLFGDSSITPLSRQVITRRVLNRLKRKGLILETPRVVGPAGGPARLVYFLTAKGYNAARALNPGLPSRQPNLRGTSLMGHGLMCAEVALAFRHAARSNPGHELLDWECDWQAFERLGAKLVVPDAHLVYSTTEWVVDAFIEVDLATEGSRVFAWKIRRYLDLYRGGSWRKNLKVWPIVLTVAPSSARARILRRVTETVLARQLFRERLMRAMEFSSITSSDWADRLARCGVSQARAACIRSFRLLRSRKHLKQTQVLRAERHHQSIFDRRVARQDRAAIHRSSRPRLRVAPLPARERISCEPLQLHGNR